MHAFKNQKRYEQLIARLCVNKFIKDAQNQIINKNTFTEVKKSLSKLRPPSNYYEFPPELLFSFGLNVTIPKEQDALIRQMLLSDAFKTNLFNVSDIKKVTKKIAQYNIFRKYLDDVVFSLLLKLELDHRFFSIILAILLKYPPDAVVELYPLIEIVEFPHQLIKGQLYINIGPRTRLGDLTKNWKQIVALRESQPGGIRTKKIRERPRIRQERDLLIYHLKRRGKSYREIVAEVGRIFHFSMSLDEVRKAFKRVQTELP